MNYPTVSFVVCTYNSGGILHECLSSIVQLDYPKESIEILVVDGGSKDETLSIAEAFGARVVHERTRRPEAATAIGYNEARHEYIVNFPSDNVITEPDWLQRMMRPFMEHDNVCAVETLRYYYSPSDTMLNRYFALLGASDPVAYYLNKRDRISYTEDSWPLDTPVRDCGDYYLVEFNERTMPTLGANGFIIRRDLITQVTGDPMRFFHIDSTLDLLRMGHTQFAFVKNTIWHKTGARIKTFVRHRIRYAKIYFQDKPQRRYHLYDGRHDFVMLLRYICFSLTLIQPVMLSVRGFIKKRDVAWFLHPVMCLFFVGLYGAVTARNVFKKYS